MNRLLSSAILLGILVLTGATTPSVATHTPEQALGQASAGWPIGDLALVDTDGNPFVTRDLHERWTLLAVADSRCGERCDGTLSALSGMLRRIAGTRVLSTTQVVVVSLRADDAPADLGRLLAPYDPRLIGVTGRAEDLAGLADDLGIDIGSGAGPSFTPLGVENRIGSLWLIGPDGTIRAELLPPFDPLLLTAAYLKLRLRG
jgi:cytochrome oxidase Cu insertion factor (SCO1/SenC/PrrC family)